MRLLFTLVGCAIRKFMIMIKQFCVKVAAISGFTGEH